MKRNHFIKILSAWAGGAVVVSGGAYFAAPSRNKIAEKVILNSLSYLKLDKNGVKQFVSDYFSYQPGVMENLRWKYYFIVNKDISDSNVLYEMVRIYLISSDFFTNGMDKNRIVQYTSFYNPYKGKVINPFSRLLNPSNSF